MTEVPFRTFMHHFKSQLGLSLLLITMQTKTIDIFDFNKLFSFESYYSTVLLAKSFVC